MADMNITIPFPVLTGGEFFTVSIYNSSSIIVYTAAETNAVFTVPGLPSNDYVLRVSFNGAQVDYCFPVFECECPILYSSEITVTIGPGGLAIYYLELSFDYSAVSPLAFSCPFYITIDDGVRPAFGLPINSLADFTSNAGGIYTKKIYLNSDHAAGDITMQSSGIICDSYSESYSCTAPLFPTYPVNNAIVLVASQYVLQLTFPDRGVDCHTMSVNYLQIDAVPTPDSGTYLVSLPIGAYPLVVNIPLTPDPTHAICNYVISFQDCCGNITTVSYYATNY